jgi:serine/threonine protein kinase
VVKARHKETDRVYAIKTIEKATVERMKKRHPNINNEILMEKRALHKLQHPGIVTLYATFQDYGTLYYQMEYLAGKELFSHLHDVQLTGFLTSRGANMLGENGNGVGMGDRGTAQVGCAWSLARLVVFTHTHTYTHTHTHTHTH